MLNACIRCSTLLIGVVAFLEAVIYGGFSIWFMTMYNCAAEPVMFQTQVNETNPLSSYYLFYISYIRGDCRDPELHWVAPSAERTYHYFTGYAVLSLIWTVTIIFMLVGTCGGARGGTAKCIYYPFILVTAACCVLDIAATVTYSIDISKTTTPEDYLKFLEIPQKAREQLHLYPATMGKKTLAPAISMVLMVSRAVIVWLLNLFFVIFGLQGVCTFSKVRNN